MNTNEGFDMMISSITYNLLGRSKLYYLVSTKYFGT